MKSMGLERLNFKRRWMSLAALWRHSVDSIGAMFLCLLCFMLGFGCGFLITVTVTGVM